MGVTMMASPSSAGGLLAMLNEPHPALKLHALEKINSLIHIFWPEISTSVPAMSVIRPPLSGFGSRPLLTVFCCLGFRGFSTLGV